MDLVAASADTAQLLAISGIGKSMAANIQAIVATGSMPLRDELLAKYGAGLLELLKLPGMGPKTVALLWDAGRISSIDQLADAIDAGRLKGLPRMGEKQIEKIRKGIEDYRAVFRPLPHRRSRGSRRPPHHLPARFQRDRTRHTGRFAAPRPGNRRRSRPAGHRAGLRTGTD